MIGGDLGTRALLKAIPIIRCSLASDHLPFFFLCCVIFTYKRRRRRKHILGKGPSYSAANANAYEIVISLISRFSATFYPNKDLTKIKYSFLPPIQLLASFDKYFFLHFIYVPLTLLLLSLWLTYIQLCMAILAML